MLNILLAALCGALAIQNRALKAGGAAPAMAPLRPGDHVRPFTIHAVDGEPGSIRFDDPSHRYLLFVFSTTCPYCEESLPRIEEIVRTAANPAVAPLAVSIHTLPQTARFVVEHPISFRVVCVDSSDDFQRRNRISGVPTTILVDGRGVVRKVWEGDVTADLAANIRAALAHS